jgi:uncharacterized Zn-binding protein involved in type VI secretion
VTAAGGLDAASLRARRRRRRRIRHAIGWVGFLLAAGGILFAAWTAVGGNDPESGSRSAPSTTAAPVTTLPSVGPFPTTDGVNVRAAPSTQAAVVGLLQLGDKVMVHCAAQGDPVTTAGGTQSIWVQVTAGTLNGYVNASFVNTGQVLADPEKIPDCPAQ